MHSFLLALALLPAVALAGEPDPAGPATPLPAHAKACPNASAQWARRDAAPVTPRKLAQEPTADQYLTVLRLENGCDVPVRIRQDIGGARSDQH